MGNKLNKVLIVTSEPFPNGNAPSKRIINYCLGFNDNNYLSEVIVIKPNQFMQNNNFNYKGEFNSIKYFYPGKVVIGNSKNIFSRQFQYQYSLITSFFYLVKKMLTDNRPKIIIFYGDIPLFEYALNFIAKMFKIKTFKEESEHPLIKYTNFKYIPNKIASFIYMKLIYKSYSSILVMTTALYNYFLNNSFKESNILLINNFVRINAEIKKNPATQNYFAFCGSLDNQKDGILFLLESLCIVKKSYPNTVLKVAGFANKENLTLFHDKINFLKLTRNVEYVGHLSSSQTDSLISNAIGLLSARPNSLQASFGFPTKVLEYFATGNPVITTNTGDLKLFLKDNINSYVVDCNSLNNFHEKWIYLIENNSNDICKNAIELLKIHFNSKIETLKIINFN